MPVRILALYFGHDANLCLLEDGVPVLVLEKERVSRVKHDQGHMMNLIEPALAHVGWHFDSIDLVAFNPYVRPTMDGEQIQWNSKGVLYTQHEDYTTSGWQGEPEQRYSELKLHLKNRKIPSIAIDHHLAHIAGALFSSPFEKANILTSDGGGDNRFCASAYGEGHKIRWIEYDWGHAENGTRLNIGSAWASVGQRNFGFRRLEGAGKLMGLASYADPEEHLVQLSLNHFAHYWAFPFPSYLFEKEIQLKPKDPFAQEVAAALQEATTRVLMKEARRMKDKSGAAHLCLTGGVAMNCVTNGVLHTSDLYEDTFVPAQPSDSGLALGMALFVWHHVLENARTPRPLTPYLGIDIGSLPQGATDAAIEGLSNGLTVGVAHGKAESGPRALGHRSILADPRRPDIRDHINQKVKSREWFRPFAPFVLAEDYEEWFEDFVPSRYMSYVASVRPNKRELVPGITHVDGTARPQVVYAKEAPFFHELLSRWKTITGVPVLLNTSFNSREPLVNTEEQALATWHRTDLDVVITPSGIRDKSAAAAAPIAAS